MNQYSLRNLLLGLTALTLCAGTKAQETKPIYLNTSYTFEERATDLVSRLTLEEKQSLLGNNMAAVPRLGIKTYNVWSEALHGILSGANPSVGLLGPTSFPNSVALGSTWDPSIVKRMAEAIADEARATFQTGTKGLTFWSPVVEPVRDPRWGRTGESYGEDPYLVAQMAAGFVRGLMGPDEKYMKAVPTAKHYFANNSEFDRHVGSSNIDSRDMREFYLYPYKELIEQAGLPSIMTSYGAVNHVPTSASTSYVDSIARRTYGMKGYVTGDCAAIDDIFSGHYYAKDYNEATAYGLKAGVDSDCGSIYQRYALSALEKGLITEADMDRALVNMFTIRFRTGEFDPEPMVPYTKYPVTMVSSEANRALAAEIAAKTPVLLKNEGKVLPLNGKALKKIALIGPQADDVELGPYSGRPEESSKISPYAAIKSYLEKKGYDVEVSLENGANAKSKSNLLYIAYFEIEKTDGKTQRYDATKYSSASEGITVGSGMGTEEQVRSVDDGSWTAYNGIDITGIENITIGLNIPTEGGIVEVHAGNPEGNLVAKVEATAAAGMRVGGVYGGSMPVKIPALKLGFNEPQNLYFVYKAPSDAPIDESIINTAKSADVAIVFVGTDENTATEEADRLTLTLPGNQVDLIKAVSGANPKTIVVMQTLGCVEVEEFKDLKNIPGILWTGYNGQAQGEGIARVLFGEVNPGSKLNATWYKSVHDLPAITDYVLRKHDGTNGRTLWYFDKPVSYEFGYGLSYTDFEYSNFSISKSAITPDDKITISVDVKNVGDYDGDEVVQVYLTTPDAPASEQRPLRRLKAFQRVTIPRGQTKTVSMEINCSDLWFWDMKSDRIAYDSGKYVFEIGASSKDIRGSVSATMSGAFTPKLKVLVADYSKSTLRIGESLKARITASLTDDSFFDVSKGETRWSSNAPEVVSVDASGLLTAKSMGVATITCTLSDGGVTISDDFAVKVMPELSLKSLTIGGKAVKLDGKSHQFSQILSASAKVPTVSATALDPRLKLEITQASSVPGTATIAIIDEQTGDSESYIVNFGTKAVSDKFDKGLGGQWNVIRPDDTTMKVSGGVLTLSSSKGDITDGSNDAPNIVLQSANSDWTMTVKLSCATTPASPAQNAGLVAYTDDDNFVKFVYSATFSFRRPGDASSAPAAGQLQLLAEEAGSQKTLVSLPMTGIVGADNTLWLRLSKSGESYTAYYSVDGKKFVQMGEVSTLLKDIQVGMMVAEGTMPARFRGFGGPGSFQTPKTEPLSASFDDFTIYSK